MYNLFIVSCWGGRLVIVDTWVQPKKQMPDAFIKMPPRWKNTAAILKQKLGKLYYNRSKGTEMFQIILYTLLGTNISPSWRYFWRCSQHSPSGFCIHSRVLKLSLFHLKLYPINHDFWWGWMRSLRLKTGKVVLSIFQDALRHWRFSAQKLFKQTQIRHCV